MPTLEFRGVPHTTFQVPNGHMWLLYPTAQVLNHSIWSPSPSPRHPCHPCRPCPGSERISTSPTGRHRNLTQHPGFTNRGVIPTGSLQNPHSRSQPGFNQVPESSRENLEAFLSGSPGKEAPRQPSAPWPQRQARTARDGKLPGTLM